MGRRNRRCNSSERSTLTPRSNSSSSFTDYSPESNSVTAPFDSSSYSVTSWLKEYSVTNWLKENWQNVIGSIRSTNVFSLLYFLLLVALSCQCYYYYYEFSNVQDYVLLKSSQYNEELTVQSMYLHTLRQTCDLQVSKLVETICELESLYNSAIGEMVRELKVADFVYYNSTICGGNALP